MFNTLRKVVSKPYSCDPSGNRNWRFRVVDIHVFVHGPPTCRDDVVSTLESSAGVLKQLDVTPDEFSQS